MKFADPLDQASHLAATLNEDGVRDARRKAAPEQEQLPDGTWPTTECVGYAGEECGDDLPEARLKMGRIRCVRCQQKKEKREAGY